MNLTTEEAARIVGVKPGTIRQWVRRGSLRPIRPGRPHIFKDEDVTQARRLTQSATRHKRAVAKWEQSLGQTPGICNDRDVG